MRIWHISDSHTFHKEYKVPENIDVVAFTGDESNHMESALNHNEFLDFVEWFKNIDVRYKLFIPGNHSIWIFNNEKLAKSILNNNGIIWLHKQELIIEDIKFYGDGISPTFGNWSYMCKREKINKHWDQIPEDVTVLLTHTPPKSILDLTEECDYNLTMCGCSALLKKVSGLKKLKVHLFGHIHNFKSIVNIGCRELNGIRFYNGAAIEDGRFDKGVIFNGNIIDI